MGLFSIFKFMSTSLLTPKSDEHYVKELLENTVKFTYSTEYSGILLYLLNCTYYLKVFEEQTQTAFVEVESTHYFGDERIELSISSDFRDRVMKLPKDHRLVKEEMIDKTLKYLETEGYFEQKEHTNTFNNNHGVSVPT
jgi:hypothetical protein